MNDLDSSTYHMYNHCHHFLFLYLIGCGKTDFNIIERIEYNFNACWGWYKSSCIPYKNTLILWVLTWQIASSQYHASTCCNVRGEPIFISVMVASWFCEKSGWIGKVEDVKPVLLKTKRISIGNHFEEDFYPDELWNKWISSNLIHLGPDIN